MRNQRLFSFKIRKQRIKKFGFMKPPARKIGLIALIMVLSLIAFITIIEINKPKPGDLPAYGTSTTTAQ